MNGYYYTHSLANSACMPLQEGGALAKITLGVAKNSQLTGSTDLLRTYITLYSQTHGFR